MENILIIGVFILQLLHNFLPVSAFPKRATESFIIHYLEDKRIIPVRIELNTNSQTEHVTSITGETLYDFNQRKVAYKDFNSSQCFIMDIVEESLEGDRRRLKKLQKGVVRGFYLPTFIIKEELTNTTNLIGNFGILLMDFCTGNTISLVAKETHRKKRDTSGEKGQFTHHAYGHYGHQSNNYAHYGHETYIKGTLDQNGQIQNQEINHQQIRSESSHVYPRPANRNIVRDSSRSDASRPVYRNGRQDSTLDSRTSLDIPQTQYQTQHHMPSYQQTLGNGLRSPGIGGTGQFALQSSHEGGYQLSLPVGLQAGNVYRGGIRSGGHYGVGGLQPQITTEYQQYPASSLSSSHQPFDHREPLPPVVRPSYPSTLPGMSSADVGKIPLPPVVRPSYPSTVPGVSSTDIGKIPSPIQPKISSPAMITSGDRGISYPAGLQTPDAQIPFITRDQRQPGIDYDSQFRKQVDHRAIPSGQITPSAEDHSSVSRTFIHPPSPDSRIQTAGRQPETGLPSIYMPTRTIQSPLSIPGQITGGIPGSDISDMQRVTGISRPRDIHTTYPDLVSRQQPISGGIMPQQQYLQTPDVRQPKEYRTNGDIQGRPVSHLHIPGISPGYPSTADAIQQQVTGASFPGSPAIPGMPHMTRPVSHETIRNGVRYPDATRPGTTITGEYPISGTFPGISRVPTDSQGTSVAQRPGETIYDSQYGLGIPPRGIASETSVPTDGRLITGQTGFETSKIYGQNGASSQTQIQTGLEGTAAEASAAGQYGGLGSQTQVQGGYVGNGSFSAQAQSGFTGGVVQSQVQGGKQGGLSGSSAQVERIGSAQSQVQILQPSGSASSTAQGRFAGGTTQVQTQGSKTGGSAGAQSQSTGLSNSHVQINIGGSDASKEENFQGTVLASVHGGQLSGQSQAQLQGGYNSGRTYAATAQGGFDTALEFQAAVPPVGSLINLSGKTLGGRPISGTGSQESLGQQHQISGIPVSREPSDITQHQVLMPPRTVDSRAQYPSSVHKPPSLLPSSQSIDRRTYPGYPTEDIDRRIIPTSSDDFFGHRQFDDRGILTPGFPQTDTARIPQQQTQFGIQIPETQDKALHKPGLQRPTYTSLPAPTLTGATDQHYLSRIPSTSHLSLPSTYHPSQPSATIHSIPSISTRPQQSGLQPGFQMGYLPPSHFPDQSQILTPSSQIIPSQGRPGEMPALTRPDGGLYIEPPRQQHPIPDLTHIQPQQPQFLTPSSQLQPRPQIQSQYPHVSLPRPQMQPEQIPIFQQQPQIRPQQPQVSPQRPQIRPQQPQVSPQMPQIRPQQPQVSPQMPQIRPDQPQISPQRPQIRPDQPQISPQKPQIPATTEKDLALIPSRTTDTKPGGVPGVSEPDESDCCAALRDLKNRCCGRISKQDETTSCCRSNTDDIFDFSSEDDQDENNQPCKVVKAICYIVYKPVGKARVCKPTETNRC